MLDRASAGGYALAGRECQLMLTRCNAALRPRPWGREAEAAVTFPVTTAYEQLGSAGEECSAMSGNIAVIYAGDLAAVAEAFGEAAAHLAARVRVLRVGGGESDERAGGDPRAGLGDLEWADGIAFGTPIGDGAPAAHPDAVHREHRAALEQRATLR